MDTVAVIVAAGSGSRFGAAVPKQYLRLGSEMVLTHTLRSALAAPGIARILVAIDPAHEPLYREAVEPLVSEAAEPRGGKAIRLRGGAALLPPVAGGAERADTVRRALEALAGASPAKVLVHDAARPFASPALWARVAAAVGDDEGAIPAEPVVDALWRGAGDHAEAPVPRADLWRAQTPQGFPFAPLLAAHRAHGAGAADDAEVFRRAGHRVRLVAGETDNFKITTPADIERAEWLLAARRALATETRVGQGFDVHRFGPGDHVMLGGVAIPHGRGLVGHSDADVALHALCDALYGALGEGDIGTHFPPSDPQWKGAASAVFLRDAAERVAVRGGRIVNLDLTILAEAPRIGPHAGVMRACIGGILGLAPDRIGIKATTMERLGFIGRGEGIAALASATLVLPRRGA